MSVPSSPTTRSRCIEPDVVGEAVAVEDVDGRRMRKLSPALVALGEQRAGRPTADGERLRVRASTGAIRNPSLRYSAITSGVEQATTVSLDVEGEPVAGRVLDVLDRELGKPVRRLRVEYRHHERTKALRDAEALDRRFSAVVRNRVSACVAVIRARDGPDNGDRLVDRDWFAVLIRRDPCDQRAQVSRLESCEEMMPSGEEHESHGRGRELHIA